MTVAQRREVVVGDPARPSASASGGRSGPSLRTRAAIGSQLDAGDGRAGGAEARSRSPAGRPGRTHEHGLAGSRSPRRAGTR